MQKSVEQFDVIDPETNEIFLKVLPSKCFPDKPDQAMEEWYEGVAARLKREADAEAKGERVEDEPQNSADVSGDGSSADERTGAFKYFEDPMYRKARPKPTFMRHVSKDQARASNDYGPVSRVRHMLNPFSRRRSLPPGRYEDDSYSDEDATPIASNPPSAQRHASHKRPHPPRRESSLSTTDSDSDPDNPLFRHRTPVLRPPKSNELPTSPREYFPAYYEQYRPSPPNISNDRSDVRMSSAPSPQPVYGPTKSPLFATQIAQLQARNYYERPAMPARASHRPAPSQNVRYAGQSTPVSPQRDIDPAYARDQDRYRHRDRDVLYEGGGTSSNHSSQSHRRHSSTGDAVYPRERSNRDRDAARTRSHDRVKDEWDERERDRSRDKRGYDRSREHSNDRDRDRDRHRGTHRYVAGVEGGVSGRRYPVMSANPY